jgi:hypothetical protein
VDGRRAHRVPTAVSDTLAQCSPRLAAIQKHGAEVVVGFEEPHRWVSVPEPQAPELVRALHVRHAELQDCGLPVRATPPARPPTRSSPLRWRSRKAARPIPTTGAPALGGWAGSRWSHAARSGVLVQFCGELGWDQKHWFLLHHDCPRYRDVARRA